jgi:hypothetical protein
MKSRLMKNTSVASSKTPSTRRMNTRVESFTAGKPRPVAPFLLSLRLVALLREWLVNRAAL